MPRLDSAEFQKWLDLRSGIDPDAERTGIGCEQCGTSESVYPLMRGYCVVCLGFMYGQFVKCQQIMMWLDANLPLSLRGDLNDRAAALVTLGSQYRLPLADETDEEFAAYYEPFAERRR